MNVLLTQPQLIDQIVTQIQGTQTINNKETPAASTNIQHCNETAGKCSGQFHYRSVICKVNYLEKRDKTRQMQLLDLILILKSRMNLY